MTEHIYVLNPVLYVQVSLLPLGKEPTMGDAVQCRAHNAFRLVNMDPAQAPDMQEGLVKVQISANSCGSDCHMLVAKPLGICLCRDQGSAKSSIAYNMRFTRISVFNSTVKVLIVKCNRPV